MFPSSRSDTRAAEPSAAALEEAGRCTGPRVGARRATSDGPGSPIRKGAKRAVKVRRFVGRFLLLLPPFAVLAFDLGRRHARIFGFETSEIAFYFLSAACGVLLWISLYGVATRHRGVARWPVRVVLVIGALLAIGGQVYTFDRYQAYMNHRAVLVGTSFLPSIGQQLWFDRWTFARALVPWLLVAMVLPWLLSKLAPMRSRARGWLCLDLAIVAAVTAAFVSPERGAEQGQPPDVMYVSAMGQLARARWDHNETVERVHPGRRTPEPVPRLLAKPRAKSSGA